MGVVKKDNQTFVSFSVKNLAKKAKKLVRKFFGWVHKKLTQWENTLLKKIDEWAEEKLEFRLNGEEAIIE